MGFLIVSHALRRRAAASFGDRHVGARFSESAMRQLVILKETNMSATYRAIQPIATGRLRTADLPITAPAGRILSLLVLALILRMPTAHAEDQAKQGVTRLGEHPAVIVARSGVLVDPTSTFNLHPALSRGLQRPMEDQAKQGVSRLGEHPA